MQPRPFLDQFSCPWRTNFTFDDPIVKIDEHVLSLMLRVKMRRCMVIKEHANDDTEKRRYGRHIGIVPDSSESGVTLLLGFGRTRTELRATMRGVRV